MNESIINLYTGMFSDNINKEKQGTAISVILMCGSESKHMTKYDPTQTYMPLWMDTIAHMLEQVAEQATLPSTLSVFVHMWNNNVHTMCKKLFSIYNELNSHDQTFWSVLPLKLRRKNKSYYEYHDAMMRIVTSLLIINQRVDNFMVHFNATMPYHCGDMRTAQQLAERALIDG